MSRASSKLRIQSTRNTQLFLFKSFHNFEPFKLASTPAQAFINIFITSLILVSTGRDHLELSWTVIRIHFQAPAIFGKEQEGSCVNTSGSVAVSSSCDCHGMSPSRQNYVIGFLQTIISSWLVPKQNVSPPVARKLKFYPIKCKVVVYLPVNQEPKHYITLFWSVKVNFTTYVSSWKT